MGIPASVRAHVQFTAVQRELIGTARLAADAALLSGRAEQILPALRRATAQEPLDEPLHARLVLVLAACGLQAEALRTYDDIRHRLATDLSLTPGPELTAAHTRVLRQELRRPRASAPAVGQLPPGPGAFAGREAESQQLTRLADESAVLVCGMPGVGKTTLAVAWAHGAADRFPDGRLHIDLRGSDPVRDPVPPADALRELLTALEVPAHRMPDGRAALAGLYRTLLAERRVLVVLDDAADTEQLRPLLPTAPGSLALVTSRNALPGLVATGARPLTLEPPSTEDARAILTEQLRTRQPTAAPAPSLTHEIVTHCAQLPLALSAVADRIAAAPGPPLTAVVAELRDAHGGLDALSALRAPFLASYRRLPADSARLFLLMPRHPGRHHLTPETVAPLAGLPVRRARLLLAQLAEAHLLGETEPGRYALHDLLRAFATELAAAAAAAAADTTNPTDTS
ncbi:BTAD domain-containing putative transcriptional regulator, partial [Streptomyces sp. NPDC002920]